MVDGLATIADFLRQHPHEVVILSIEDYITPEDTYEAFRNSGLLALVYTPDDDGEWPTLRELIDQFGDPTTRRVEPLALGCVGARRGTH